ncbi:thiocillin family RiPP [Solibacillus sp. FSL W7-1464]|uniref:thiocillin family RiPP n=1 Tax=Solibacillus sp. FSL W7-1464 TaxID=2921706 RepID=UPI0030FB357A
MTGLFVTLAESNPQDFYKFLIWNLGEKKIFIEEQNELNEVAASFSSLSTVSSGSCFN